MPIDEEFDIVGDTMQWARRQDGFTIVELLIVVVVIAILAAITIVSYNGITQRARISVLESSLSTAQKKLATHVVADDNGLYPTALSTVGIEPTDTITYQYYVNNSSTPRGYCVAATSDTVTYRFAYSYTYTTGGSPTTISDGSPQQGTCPESEVVVPPITNYAKNPSAETGETGYGSPNSSGRTRTNAQAHSGSYSILATVPNGSAAGTAGLSIFQENPFTTLLPNTEYVASAYVYIPTGSNDIRVVIQGAGVTGVANNAESYGTGRNGWIRIWNRFTTLSSGNVTVFLLNRYAASSGAITFYADSFMITPGTTPYTYADGNSPGWSWTGTADASSSTGPPL